jgi:uncharacterized cupin superfamily protein
MTDPVSSANAEHYTWGGSCDGWHLVRSNRLSVIEECMPPGSAEQRHFHVRARQFFYVLDGELTIEIEGHLQLIRPRQGIEILPGQAHEATNRSGNAVRFLVISQPPGQADRQPA